MTLRNRIVKSAAGSEMQDNDTWPSDAALAYYGQFCDGGVGMVCYEASTVVPLPAGADGRHSRLAHGQRIRWDAYRCSRNTRHAGG